MEEHNNRCLRSTALVCDECFYGNLADLHHEAMTLVTFVTLIPTIGSYARACGRLSQKCVTNVTNVTRPVHVVLPFSRIELTWYTELCTRVESRLRFQADAEKFTFLCAAVKLEAFLIHFVVKALTRAGRMTSRQCEFLP